MPSSHSKRQSSAGKNPTANAGLMDLLRAGAQQSSSQSSQQNPLMAAAQQFAAAAAAAQQFAAAAQMMAMVGNGDNGAAAASTNHHSSVISSPPVTTPKRKKPKVKKVKAESSAANGVAKNDESAVEDLGEDGKRAVANFWSSLGFRSETERDSHRLPTSNLPREPEHNERKRPAAIQELLLMKKQRMNCNTQESDISIKCEEPMNTASASSSQQRLSPSKSPAAVVDRDNTGSSHLSEIINQICSGHDQEDTETTTSSGSRNSNPASAADSDGGGGDKSGTCPSMNGCSRRKAQRPVAIISVEREGDEGGEEGAADYYLTDDDCLLNGELSSPNASPPYGTTSLTPKKRKKATNNGPATPTNRAPMADNDGVTVSPLAALVPHDQLFAQVPGRLSLLSNVVKYRMSVGEVKRRLMGPESFNFSLLGALLRRAKMPEKSQMLVDELAQVGLTIPRGRRRLSQVTLLSALTESESVQFAKDFQKIAEVEFPSKQMAELAVSREFGSSTPTYSNAQRLSDRLEQLETTLQLAVSFVELLSQDRSPVMDSMPDAVFDQEVQDPLCTFSMLTHGFGTPALLVGMQTFLSFVKYQIQLLKERRKQQQLINPSHTA